jgi:hypothetical protein
MACPANLTNCPDSVTVTISGTSCSLGLDGNYSLRKFNPHPAHGYCWLWGSPTKMVKLYCLNDKWIVYAGDLQYANYVTWEKANTACPDTGSYTLASASGCQKQGSCSVSTS